MNSILIRNLTLDQQSFQISNQDEQYHHLKNVLRLKENEDICILNGQGLLGDGRVRTISKKEIVVDILGTRYAEKSNWIEVYCGMVKQDIFEDIVRACVEVNVSKIIPVYSSYSNVKKYNSDRLERIITSSVLQSKNPYMLDISGPITWEEFESICVNRRIMSFLEIDVPSKAKDVKTDIDGILLGPEGGFSESEIQFLLHNTKSIHFELPILRTKTALPFALGFVFNHCGNWTSN